MLHFVKNEKGILLPATILLLFIVCLALLTATSAYQSKFQVYDSLEKSNTKDAIEKLNRRKTLF